MAKTENKRICQGNFGLKNLNGKALNPSIKPKLQLSKAMVFAIGERKKSWELMFTIMIIKKKKKHVNPSYKPYNYNGKFFK